jgi:hypothetical protein
MPGDMAFCLEESERDFSAREITLFAWMAPWGPLTHAPSCLSGTFDFRRALPFSRVYSLPCRGFFFGESPLLFALVPILFALVPMLHHRCCLHWCQSIS